MHDESGLVESIYVGLSDPVHWQEFLDGFRARLRARHSVFVLAHHEDSRLSLNMTSGMTEAQFAEFLHWGPEDPWAARVDWAKTYLGEFKASHEICPDEILEALPVYREFLQPNGYHYGGGILVAASKPLHAVVSFSRPKALGPVDSEEAAFCRRLSPHLVRAVGLYDERLRTLAERESAMALMDASGISLFLLGEKGQIRLANEPGRRALRERRVIAEHRGAIRAIESAANARLYQAIRSIASGATERGLMLSSGEHVRWANLAGLASRGNGGFSFDAPTMTLILTDPSARPPLFPEPLQQLYGLTRAEALVALKLAFGWSAAEAAAQSGITMATARTHIKRILSKMGCTRQAELVGLVLRVAHPASLTRHRLGPAGAAD